MARSIRNLLLAASTSLMLMTTQIAFAHSAHCKDTELSKLMESMKKELKAYASGFNAGDSAAMRLHLNALLKDSREARTLVPMKLEHQTDMSADLARYQQGIDHLSDLLQQLSTAEGDKKKIEGLLADVKQHSKESHREFRKECD